MKKKIFTLVYTVMAFAVLFAGFALILCGLSTDDTAFAAEPEIVELGSESETQVDTGTATETEGEKGDDFNTVFKNDILPLIISAVIGTLTLLITVFPYIKLIGKNKSLQGMYTALTKTVERYKEKEDVFTVDNFLYALKENIIEELKGYISSCVEKIVKENHVDNTDSLSAIKVTTDTLCAQFNNLLKAASLAWREAPGASELLAKSPTSEVLNEYYNKYLELKKAIEEKQSAEIAEVDGKLKELEAYHEDEQSAV